MEDLSRGSRTARTVEAGDAVRPYPPSFIDRFLDAIGRLPGPFWLPYLVLFLLFALLNHALAWADGWVPAFRFNSLLLVFPLWIWAPPAIMTYLNTVAREALASFSPLLGLEPDGLERLRYEFTTIPPRPVALTAIAWCAVFLVAASVSAGPWAAANGAGLAFMLFFIVEGAASFFAGGAMIFHSLRQLGLVNHTVKMVKQFNLFRREPVYAFSRLTARTGAAWMIMLTLTLLTFPREITGPATVGVYVLDAVFAVAVFVLPLQFVRRRLVAEKRGLLAGLDRRLEVTLERLHGAVDGAEMSEMQHFYHALAALKEERDALSKLPTLPWRTATLSAFLSAILLPLVLFVLQTILARLLAR